MKRLQNLLIYRFDFHHGNDQLLLCDPSQKIPGTFKFELQTSNLKHFPTKSYFLLPRILLL